MTELVMEYPHNIKDCVAVECIIVHSAAIQVVVSQHPQFILEFAQHCIHLVLFKFLDLMF